MKTTLSKKALKNLSKLDKRTSKRIVDAIKKLPDGHVIPLHNHASAFRLRVGDFRILFCQRNEEIYIDDVLPRGSAYNK